MDSLRYNPGKLLLRALTAGLASAGSVALYIDPEWADIGLWTMVLGDGIGHDVLAPATAAFFALLAWRSAALAFGRCMALEIRDGTLTATTFWRSTSVPVHALVDVRLEDKRTRWRTITRLILRIAREADIKTIRIPLGMTDLAKFRYPKLVTDLEMLAGCGSQSATAAQSDTAATNFDADAAIARYMARKASEPAQPAPDLPAAAGAPVRATPVPARPAFGRKGV